METIRLTTWIDAPVERCFQLSRSIDLHLVSAAGTGEEAVDGVRTGLIGKGEMVTWRGRHLGIKLKHTSRIDAWRPYSYFRDGMVEGVFQHFEHEHFFAPMDDGTRMRDEVRFGIPFGALGRLGTTLFVRRYLTEFLKSRNAVIKRVAESEEWHRYLDGQKAIVQETHPGEAGFANVLEKGAVARG